MFCPAPECRVSVSPYVPHMSGLKWDIPKLTDENDINNYGQWSTEMRMLLKNLDLWKHVEGPLSTAPIILVRRMTVVMEGIDTVTGANTEIRIPGNDAEVDKAITDAELWQSADNDAKHLMMSALPPKKRNIIDVKTSVKQYWQAIREEYCPQNILRGRQLVNKLSNFQCTAVMDVSKWCDSMREIFSEIGDQDPDLMDNAKFVIELICLLPMTDEWKVFHAQIRKEHTDAVATPQRLNSS